MLKHLIFIPLLVWAMPALSGAADLYKISIENESQARIARSLDIEPIMLLHDGYLVLAEASIVNDLESRLPSARRIASNVEFDRLAIDRRRDGSDSHIYPPVFEQGDLRIVEIDPAVKFDAKYGSGITPLRRHDLEISYHRPKIYDKNANLAGIDLDSLIGLIQQDSVESYLYRLEAFQTRLTGTDSNYAARDWIAAKFASFGYDSVVIDPFIGSQLWDRVPVQSYNVVCTKVGTRYPDRQIIVGGHFDAVPDCPGADDNGTGTTGVLEIARALKDIETEMTFVFIAFDSEESWMWGSYHYADSVGAENANIIYMQNLDMIGHFANSDHADLYYGPEIAYSILWGDLADSLVGITGDLSGYTASDHTPFMDNGYDVTFVQEKNFSTHYHQPSDSTTYINFEYMTRMIKASLATVYTINFLPPPVRLISVLDVGDGQSLQVTWEPGDPGMVDHYLLCYGPVSEAPSDTIFVPSDSIGYVVSGLQEGLEYFFHIVPTDIYGRTALAYDQLSGTPFSRPMPPGELTALPLVGGIKLTWDKRNQPLDFDHYQVIRDTVMLPDDTYDTIFEDMSPDLGSDYHQYWVVAVDTDDNISDTTGLAPAISRAATLRPDRILAINRSGSNTAAMVDETATGSLIREALEGLTYDYISDTSSSNPDRVDLLDMIDYGLIIIGDEAARQDDIGGSPTFGGILDQIGYYLSIGGKAIIFGRWGDVTVNNYFADTIYYSPGDYNYGYHAYFNILARVIPRSNFNNVLLALESDMIGAHTQVAGYPELVWDSVATVMHHPNIPDITGVPCPSYVMLYGSGYEIVYTYNSSVDSVFTEGMPVGWRSVGGPYDYVFFDIPLSFMDHNSAIAALRQAMGDMGIISDVDSQSDHSPLPDNYALAQNYPNPFNPKTVIGFFNPESKPAPAVLEVFNILGQRVRLLFNEASLPGWNRVEWDGRDEKGRDVTTGVYFYRLKIGTASLTRKMLLLK
jgi:aminopeptidase YwaD